MAAKRRFGYLDLLKVIAIMGVCLYHFPMIRHTAYARPFGVGVLVNRYFRMLNVVCVPLFMMVNGALVLNRSFDCKKHMRRCASLFAGAYVWYMATIILGHAWKNGWDYVAQNWGGMLRSAQYLGGYDGIGVSHLWFVQMLVALYLLVPLIKAVLDSGDVQIRRGMGFMLGALGVLSFALNDIANVRAAVPVLRELDFSCLDTFNPMKSLYGSMLVYFVLGGLLHRAYDRLVSAPLWVSAGMTLGGSLALFVEWYLVTIRTETMADMVYGGYGTLPALAMTAGLFILAAKLEQRFRVSEGPAGRVIALVGRNTLAVYYLHWIAGLTLLEYISLPGCFAVNLVKAAAMVLLCSLAGEGMRRIPLLSRRMTARNH